MSKCRSSGGLQTGSTLGYVKAFRQVFKTDSCEWSLEGQHIHQYISWLRTAGLCLPDISGFSRTRVNPLASREHILSNYFNHFFKMSKI